MDHPFLTKLIGLALLALPIAYSSPYSSLSFSVSVSPSLENTVSLSSSNVTVSGSVSTSSVTATTPEFNVLGGEIAHLAAQVASSLAIQSAGNGDNTYVSASTSLRTATVKNSTPLQTAIISSASSAMTSASASTHGNSSLGLHAISKASNIPKSMSSAGTSSATSVPGTQPNTITIGPTSAFSTLSLNPTGSVATSQAMLLIGAILSITEEAKTLSAIIKDDGLKESFISKINRADDGIIDLLDDIHPDGPPPSYEDACLDGGSIFNIAEDLGCLEGAFGEVVSDLEDDMPDVAKIQINIDNIGKLAENLEKEEEDDDDDKTSISETTSQASETQNSATKGLSTLMSTTLGTTSTGSSRMSSRTSTATVSMQPMYIDRYPIADLDTSNYSTPNIADQALMAFFDNILSSAVGIGPGASGLAAAIGSVNATASFSSSAMMPSSPTNVRTSSSALAVSLAAAAAGSSNLRGGRTQVTATSSVPTSTAAANDSFLGGEIAALAYQIASASAEAVDAANTASPSPATSSVPTSTAAANDDALGGEIAALAYQIASASAAALHAANSASPSPSLVPSLAPSPLPTGPKWGIYLALQIYTWGGANAITDYYYKIWLTDLTTNPAGPDFCAANSWIANVQTNDGVTDDPPYPTKNLDFIIPAKTVDTAAMDCMWQPSVGNSQPGSMTCGPGLETVLCTTPTMTGITCKNVNPDRILPLAQCVWQ